MATPRGWRMPFARLLVASIFSALLFILFYRPELSGKEVTAIKNVNDSKKDAPPPPASPVDLSMRERQPQVAWIMSFGGSGTSYTIVNTEQVTGMTTASNYGGDYDPCVPLRPEWTTGPFVRSPQKAYPEKYILTKTHCGGYCMDCPLSFLTPESFEEACLTGKRGDKQRVTYSRTIPQAAIHLIRSPFDNLIGRMHLFNKHHPDRENFETTHQGLQEWCQYLGDKYPVPGTPLEKYASVPCHAEWFRYVQWHNLAWETHHQRLKIPVHYLYYDQYTDNYNATVQGVLDFLQMSAVNDPLPFYSGKTYFPVFAKEHVRAATQMVKEIAKPEVWKLLEVYFDTSEVLQPTNMHEESLLPQVAWLLSFPNSGTSYTISNTETMSATSTASNYAGDWETCHGVRPELDEKGPFLHKLDLPVPSSFVLTKTHCAAYCDDCPPRSYVVKDDKNFEKGCLTGTKNVNGVSTEVTYDTSVPARAVHLIRNPFDNLVSRLHLAIKRKKNQGWSEQELAKFTNDEAGFHAWCRRMDESYAKKEQSTSRFSNETKMLFASVPCHADLFRYVQWHNLVLRMLERKKLPVHTLHYEDYSAHFNTTVDDLFSFLQLEKKADPLPFVTGKTYSSFYSEKEARAARKLVKTLASDGTWQLVKHYFADWD